MSFRTRRTTILSSLDSLRADSEWLIVWQDIYNKAFPVLERVARLDSEGHPADLEELIKAKTALDPLLATCQQLPPPSNQNYRDASTHLEHALDACIKASEWGWEYAISPSRAKFAGIVMWTSAAAEFKEKLSHNTNMFAADLAAASLPPITEAAPINKPVPPPLPHDVRPGGAPASVPEAPILTDCDEDMYCPHCGKKFVGRSVEQGRFCPWCGSQRMGAETRCLKCGKSLDTAFVWADSPSDTSATPESAHPGYTQHEDHDFADEEANVDTGVLVRCDICGDMFSKSRDWQKGDPCPNCRSRHTLPKEMRLCRQCGRERQLGEMTCPRCGFMWPRRQL